MLYILICVFVVPAVLCMPIILIFLVFNYIFTGKFDIDKASAPVDFLIELEDKIF